MIDKKVRSNVYCCEHSLLIHYYIILVSMPDSSERRTERLLHNRSPLYCNMILTVGVRSFFTDDDKEIRS
jgi:hypothetical protein